ncbi:MAG: septum formation initiator family protein [Clostridia bacterium]|nr:septum formation initiator family protein [Clostridia bacterium]
MNKRRNSGLRFIVVLGLLVYFAYIVFDQQKVMQIKKEELKSVDEKIKQEMKLNEELKKQKEAVNTDEYTEKIAREKLGMVRQGEKVFVDIDR